MNKKIKCKLCGQFFNESEMSNEHYPARSVGNDDIVKLNLIEILNCIQSMDIKKQANLNEEDFFKYHSNMFDSMCTSAYPKGRTARTLCAQCNKFLGVYDKAYKKFFDVDGDPKILKSYQKTTKFQIIKSILGKFLSIPEAAKENFDFVNFVKDPNNFSYNGEWKLYFVKRDLSTDLFLNDLETHKIPFNNGVVYELSDEKFIYNLINFKKHENYKMTNMFDILNYTYNITYGFDEHGGYHSQLLLSKLLKSLKNSMRKMLN